MKSIKTAALAALAVGLLSATTAFAAPQVSADGFLVLTVEEVSTEKAKPKAVKQVKRAKRAIRAERSTRLKRSSVKRSKSKKSRFYRVRSGDTLTRIAVKTGVSFSKLVRLNRLYGTKKNRINAGQRLRLR
jgi:LysM repeat protein